MLKKNVYICFPAGYHGNFINWGINASDHQTRSQTVVNPINGQSSKAFGSVGTSHGHHRQPTHLGPEDLLSWILFKRPTQCQTYIVNIFTRLISKFIKDILTFDPDPEFIIIHHDNNYDNWCYGMINNLTKWPSFMESQFRKAHMKLDFDPFDCADSWNLRNSMSMSDPMLNPLARYLAPVAHMESLTWEFDRRLSWYNCRHALQPHEVNRDNFLIWDQFPWNKIHEFSLIDIPNKNFPKLLNEFMLNSGCSDSFDLGPVEAITDEYIKLQHNLQWFSSIDHWRKHGELDNFLQGHALIQGLVLKEMFFNHEQLTKILPDWQQKSMVEINEIYQGINHNFHTTIPPIPWIE
jgi:hypothetical protein